MTWTENNDFDAPWWIDAEIRNPELEGVEVWIGDRYNLLPSDAASKLADVLNTSGWGKDARTLA